MALVRIFITLIASVSFITVHADETWQWPIAGAETGDSIIYKPQTYIGEELNFDQLFIAAPLDAVVVAPDDCVVRSVGWSYSPSLSSAAGSSIEPGEDFDARAKDMAEGIGRGAEPKYVNHSIGLQVADGRTIYIKGLRIDRAFKTGESIARGDTLGRVRYSYRLIEEPSIGLSVSARGGKSDDPMTPFGLKTSFIPPQELKPVTELTVEQAHEDIDVMIDAFIDCYPSLDDLISREELEEYRRETKASVTETISIEEFDRIMVRTNALLHDSHVAYWGASKSNSPRYCDMYIGRVGDDVRIVMAKKELGEYLNRRVASVDGIAADSLLRMSAQYIGGYDAAVEDYIKNMQFGMLTWLYINNRPDTSASGYDVTFDDGTSLHVDEYIWKGEKLEFLPSRRDYMSINRTGKNFELKMLNDSVAYIGLATFQLNEVETEQIRDFIAAHHSTPHLIFDMRNNGGGHDEVMHKLLSYCSDRPYVAVDGYSKVMRRRSFPSFAHARNYTADMELFGDEYVAEEGRDGLYCRNESKPIMPDSVAHYGGKLYVLVNEGSCSAATLFPANVIRSHRGLVIGRETRTAYHYMTALKFVDICLPNSRVTWHIPLVKCVFDTTENSRIPYGRGVIPDIYVPLTYEEVAFTNGDAILNRALEAIANGEYLGENPFADEVAGGFSIPKRAWLTAVIIALVTFMVTLRRRKRR